MVLRQVLHVVDGGIQVWCSLGATHAVNLYFRRPDLFNGTLALSGIYTADYGFDGYMDDLVYLNTQVWMSYRRRMSARA